MLAIASATQNRNLSNRFLRRRRAVRTCASCSRATRHICMIPVGREAGKPLRSFLRHPKRADRWETGGRDAPRGAAVLAEPDLAGHGAGGGDLRGGAAEG